MKRTAPSASGGDGPNGIVAMGGAANAGGDVEVVPSGNALNVVSGWLGMSIEEALQEAGPVAAAQAAPPPRRQPFLGLGAKYLPHHKAVETASALDTKLRKRLERSLATRRQAEQDELEEEGPATGLGGGRGLRGIKGKPHVLLKGRAVGGAGGGRGGGADGGGGKVTTPGTNGSGRGAARAIDRDDNDDEDDDEEDRKAAGPRRTSAGHPEGVGAGASSKAAREALLLAPVGGGGTARKGKGKRQRAAPVGG